MDETKNIHDDGADDTNKQTTTITTTTTTTRKEYKKYKDKFCWMLLFYWILFEFSLCSSLIKKEKRERETSAHLIYSDIHNNNNNYNNKENDDNNNQNKSKANANYYKFQIKLLIENTYIFDRERKYKYMENISLIYIRHRECARCCSERFLQWNESTKLDWNPKTKQNKMFRN